jgi:hypothetical protein
MAKHVETAKEIVHLAQRSLRDRHSGDAPLGPALSDQHRRESVNPVPARKIAG